MAFTIQDYHDLARLLAEHPEWREELRRLLLSDELLALPEIVRELAKAQQRTEERLDALVEAQQHFEERLSRLETTVQRLVEQVEALTKGQQRLTEQVEALTEGQQRLTERVEALTEGQQRLTERVEALTEGQQRLTDTVGGMKGRMLEITYRDRAGPYFGRLLRRAKVVEVHTLEDTLEATLTCDEFNDLLLLDLLVTGKVRHTLESPEIWLAVEISAMVDRHDVDRALRRANLLRQVGHRAVPVVAGEAVTKGGEVAAQAQNVVLVQDGRVEFWKQSIAVWENIRLVED